MAAAAATAPPVVASAAGASNQGRTWAEVAKLPDFTTGIWETPLDASAFRPQSQAELTPASNCVPPGMPQIMDQPYPMQIFFGPGQVSIQLEAYMQMRHIYTDGRKLPDDPDATYNGSSVGHWDGGALVVDTVGFVPDTPLGLSYGMHHSDKMRIHETMKLTDPDTLLVTTTVEDPEALTKPWTTTRTFKRHKDWTIAEYVCEQNNRNKADETGKAGIDLTPPPGAAQ